MKKFIFLSFIALCGILLGCNQEKSFPIEGSSYTAFTKGKLFGAKDSQGNVIVPAEYDEIYAWETNMLIAVKGGKKDVYNNGKLIFANCDQFESVDGLYFINVKDVSYDMYFSQSDSKILDVGYAGGENLYILGHGDGLWSFYSLDGQPIQTDMRNYALLSDIVGNTTYYLAENAQQNKFLFNDKGEVLRVFTEKEWNAAQKKMTLVNDPKDETYEGYPIYQTQKIKAILPK